MPQIHQASGFVPVQVQMYMQITPLFVLMLVHCILSSQVHLGFKGSSRQTTLKGSSKLACRAIVLKQYKTAINHLLQIEDLKKDIFQITKKKMSQELQQICQAKDSVLRTKNLEKFSWKKAYDELKQTCPLVTELMLLIAGNKNKQIPRIVSSIAILLFNRNSQMGAIQAINSILMFRGHIRTKVTISFHGSIYHACTKNIQSAM